MEPRITGRACRAGTIACALVVSIAVSGAALAQVSTATSLAYPSKPIRWIVAYPPGGPTDLVARVIGERLSLRVKQPVVVENRGGGFGTIGAELAVRARADGHTIFMGTSNEIIHRLLGKISVDPLTDLTPVSLLVRTTFVLLSNPNFPARTVQEVLTAAKAAPGTITCGCGATILRIGCELLRTQGRVDIEVIPYQGAALALKDLMGGQITLSFNAASTAVPVVKAKRVSVIATANPNRGIGPFGHLPTVGETLPGFELESWFGVLAPSGTSNEIVVHLNRVLAEVLDEEEVRKHLSDGGLEIAHGSPEAFVDVMRKDYVKYSKIIRAAGIKAE